MSSAIWDKTEQENFQRLTKLHEPVGRVHRLSTSPKIFYRNVECEIKIRVSHGEVFLFYSANMFKEFYEK